MPLASSARASPSGVQRAARAGGVLAGPTAASDATPGIATGKVAEKIAAAQARRLAAEGIRQQKKKPTTRDGMAVGSLAAAKAAADKEAQWRNGAADRAAEVKEMRKKQLADLETEEQEAGARIAAAKAEAEQREANLREAALRAQTEAEAAAAKEARRQAEEEAKDPFRVVWGSESGAQKSVDPAAGAPMGSAHSKPLVGMSHVPGASTENGNVLGTRPVVRQSRLYREKESGNAMKAAMGHDTLKWDTEALQGVFAGQGVYDGETEKRHERTKPAASARPARRSPSPRGPPSPRPSSQRPPSPRSLPPSVGGKSSSARSAGASGPPSSRVARRRGDSGSGEPMGDAGTGAIWIGDDMPAVPDAHSRTALERMTEINELLDCGLLTQDEFAKKRAQILADL